MQTNTQIHEKPKDPQTTLVIAAIVVLACALVALGVMAVLIATGTPLPGPLQFLTGGGSPAPGLVAATEAPTAGAEQAAPGQAAGLQDGAGEARTCGNTGSQLLLVTGADFSSGVEPLGADAVRLVQVDYSRGRLTIIAFPRDLLVQTPALASIDVEQERLGRVYQLKREVVAGSDRRRITAATGALAQTLTDNFNVTPDHFFTVQLDQVAAMVDTIGGVEINLPTTIVSDHQVTFPAGPQTLDGRLSAEFLRTYDPGGDPARLERQNLYARSLQKKLASPAVIAQLPELIRAFRQAIVTDLSPKDLVDLACMAKETPEEQVRFYEIGGDLATPDEAGALAPDTAAIQAALREWLAE